MRSLITLLLFCGLATRALSQDYIIVGNDTLRQGEVRRLGNVRISLVDDDKVSEYRMDQVSEYRQRSNVYRAFEIGGERNMYRQVVEGDLTLYKKGRHFLLTSNGQVVELNKSNFRSNLASMLKCTGKTGAISNVLFSRTSLQSVVQASNAGTCNLDRVPYRKYGVMAGYNFLNLTGSPTQSIHSKTTGRTFSVGAFFEAPLFTPMPWLYGTVEARFVAPYSAEFVFVEKTQTTHMTANLQSLLVIPGVKVMPTKGRAKPYFKFAPSLAFTKFDAPAGILPYGTSSGSPVVTVHPDNYVQFGFSTSLGVQFKVGQRKDVHLEVGHVNAAANKDSQIGISWKSNMVSIGFSL